MRQLAEVTGWQYENGGYEVRVAHYWEQNRDAMRQLEITFPLDAAEAQVSVLMHGKKIHSSYHPLV
jgi:hypothetical protein